MTLLVTGGAGFIGSNFILDWVNGSDESIVNLDKLTYAGNLSNLKTLEDDPRYHFIEGDICDGDLVLELLIQHQVRAIIHMAAESHVDRSILGPETFIQTNVVGTLRILEAARAYWGALQDAQKEEFRFIHISTDEVFGSLEKTDQAFTENHPYQPNSPYSASKASSDHLVRAHHETYGLPTVITNCSNNYGRYQFPEKLIPFCIHQALAGKSIPLYGDGQQVRDWLYVSDHCSALRAILEKGCVGSRYNIGGWNEKPNIEVVLAICSLLDKKHPRKDGRAYQEQIAFVADRAGHDRRYAVNATKIANELGWRPSCTFDEGLENTVDWYLHHQNWVEEVMSGAYRHSLEECV
jgi:dTDP-glucose 4,6-dehydratase